MNIPRAFWAIMARANLLACIVILGSLLLVAYIPQVALYGEIVGGCAVVWYCASRLVRLD